MKGNNPKFYPTYFWGILAIRMVLPVKFNINLN